MLLDQYEKDGLFFNMNFKEAAGAGLSAYRGEFILKEGEVGDAQGRRKPPSEIMKHSILLCGADKIKFASGCLDDLAQLSLCIEKFKSGLAADTLAIFFVVNIGKPMQIEAEGATLAVIPLTEGLAWNELMEMTGLEKGDFKGQGSGEKVVTLYDAVKGLTLKGDKVSLADALTQTIVVKREARGPV